MNSQGFLRICLFNPQEHASFWYLRSCLQLVLVCAGVNHATFATKGVWVKLRYPYLNIVDKRQTTSTSTHTYMVNHLNRAHNSRHPLLPRIAVNVHMTLNVPQLLSCMGMDQYLLIPFLGEWPSIYQLFWCSPGVQGFDTLPYIYIIHCQAMSCQIFTAVAPGPMGRIRCAMRTAPGCTLEMSRAPGSKVAAAATSWTKWIRRMAVWETGTWRGQLVGPWVLS